jgi:3-oxoacyl-[acyl-carrier protein] reductase
MPQPTRTALVTGASRNIGRAIALELADRGHRLVLNGRADRQELDATVAAAEERGAEAVGVLGDVADPATSEALVAAAQDRFRSVDVLVHVPAVRPHQPFLEISPEDWRQVLATNLDSLFHLCRSTLPGMVESGWGRIVGFSGARAFSGEQLGGHVTASKAGVVHLLRSIAFEFADRGITANTVVPGPIDTSRPDTYPVGGGERVAVTAPTSGAALPPIGRRGTPEEVARACAFLVSDDASYVTGQALHVNGGKHFY